MTSTPTIDRNDPQTATSATDRQLHWLLSTVAVTALEAVGWLRVQGCDRVRWLNGMVTNAIQALKPGEGCYSFALNAQGQIQGDLTTFAEPDALLLETSLAQIPALTTHFDRFIIMDDVELEDISASRGGFLVAGPQAASLLGKLGLEAPPSESITLQTQSWRGQTVQIVSAHAPLVPRFELWTESSTDRSTQNALRDDLIAQATALEGGLVDSSAIEHLRLLEGTPLFGIDIREKHLAQETGQTRALHFSKGCYLGQEIVERIRSRGNVHRTLTSLRLEGPLPAPGTPLLADGKPVGELTSAASVPMPTGSWQIGLGIARREAIERFSPITYDTPDGPGTAIPVSSPIHPPR